MTFFVGKGKNLFTHGVPSLEGTDLLHDSSHMAKEQGKQSCLSLG